MAELHENRERALSFGAQAEAYERFRPGYPAALYDAIVAAPGDAPARRALEVGAGTGKATRELLARGLEVVCVEPDPGMAEVLRANVGDAATVVVGAFEGLDLEDPPGSFDLVAAAQAWHWVEPEAGTAAAARALRPGGVLAVWWNLAEEWTGPLAEAIDAAYATHAPRLRTTSPATRPIRDEVPSEIGPGDLFDPPDALVIPWSRRQTADEYVGWIVTHSDHALLPQTEREALTGAIRTAIVDLGGGAIERPHRATALLARRRP